MEVKNRNNLLRPTYPLEKKVRPARHDHVCRQRGVALVFSLFVLIAVLLMGASAAQLALQGEKAARGERDRQIALQAAEEALMDAENDIEGRSAKGGRGALFAPDSALAFVDGCGSGAGSANLGLCLRAADGEPPVWQRIDFADESGDIKSVPYGKFTGATMPTGAGFQPFKLPRYIIELVPYHREGEEAGLEPSYCYRVTAVGFGARSSSQVVLQSFYRKHTAHGVAK
ncbi:pilus assembly PilX family protein [Janthinobacterium agaricidamnosum]|nr:PilX N-terminal domain-containing pilus assembly protein [Janthinobacterium agaricidamnosum]